MRFWDSSALVPLVIQQAGSAQVERWLADDAEVVTWTLTRVEVVSALRRLVRSDEIAESSAVQAETLLAGILSHTHVVTDVERAMELACRLLRLHPLRAADALQLAAALAWADGAPRGLVLHTFDQRLGLAATREGFSVLPGI